MSARGAVLPLVTSELYTCAAAESSIHSTALSASPTSALARLASAAAAAKESVRRSATWRAFGARGRDKATLVMTPRVPSAPRNSCFRSYPVLSLRIRLPISSDRPVPSTTWSLRRCAARGPCRTKRTPPAFVLRFPPIMHEPFAPRSNGISNPCSPARSWSVSRMQPASHSITPSAGSIWMTLLRRARERIVSPGPIDVEPPTSPVLPP
mmetsp:Transcript_40932/g.55774  ORF Transcript_40932/g.55774 Transcript_40932/m.55774 type:complete len:210 (+) Transcript_40932:850-1479(+)